MCRNTNVQECKCPGMQMSWDTIVSYAIIPGANIKYATVQGKYSKPFLFIIWPNYFNWPYLFLSIRVEFFSIYLKVLLCLHYPSVIFWSFFCRTTSLVPQRSPFSVQIFFNIHSGGWRLHFSSSLFVFYDIFFFLFRFYTFAFRHHYF